MIPNILAFDCETGGISNDTSLLTAFFAVLDTKLNVIAELDLKLIPDDGRYVVDPKALEVNKIDLLELSREAITYKQAKTELYNFLNVHSVYGKRKLVPLGQSVSFDIGFVRGRIIGEGSWDNFVERRYLDTMLVSKFLQMNGKLDLDSVSLASLVEYFGIKLDGEPHIARTDVLATVEVYKKLVEIVK